MSDRPADAVWVSGERFNVDYLLDIERGSVLREVVLPKRGGITGGIGRPCGRSFVAVYVAPGRHNLFLQVDDRRMVLDDATKAVHNRQLGGLVSRLKVSRVHEPDLTARQFLVAGAFLRRADPGYDELDDFGEDFLADVANIVNSEERRAWLFDIKDPDEGPWDALEPGRR